MDHEDAATLVLDDAARVVLPDATLNVVARIKRDFATDGHCDARLIAVIENAIRTRLEQWSLEDKRGIWDGLLESGAMVDPEARFDDYPEDNIDMTLEPELLAVITEMLTEKGPTRRQSQRRDLSRRVRLIRSRSETTESKS